MALRTAVTMTMAAVGVAVDVGTLEVYQDPGNCTSDQKMKVDEFLLNTCIGEGGNAMKLTCNNSVLTRTMYNWTNTSAAPDCAEQLEAVELSASTCASGVEAKGSCGTYSTPSANSDVIKQQKFGTNTCGSAATETQYMHPGSCDADGEGMYTKWMCDAGTVWMAKFTDSGCSTFSSRTHYAACSPMDAVWQTMTCVSKYVKVTLFSGSCEGTVNSTSYMGDWCTPFDGEYKKLNSENKILTYSDAACTTLTKTEDLEECGKCELYNETGFYYKTECVGYANVVAGSSDGSSSSSSGSSSSSDGSSGGSSDGSSSGGSSSGGSSDGGSSDGGNSSDGGSSGGSSSSSGSSSSGSTGGTAVVSATSHSGLAASVVLATVAVAFAVSK